MAATGATPAIRVVAADGARYAVHGYDHDRRNDSYGGEAVDVLTERLGIQPRQICKTLVLALSTGSLAIAVVPVPDTLSLEAAAAALGAPKAALAEQTRAERATGYVLGGISPLGQRRKHRTLIDTAVLDWDAVFCSAGRRGLEIELAPADLIRLTGAVTAAVTA